MQTKPFTSDEPAVNLRAASPELKSLLIINTDRQDVKIESPAWRDFSACGGPSNDLYTKI